MTTQIKDDALLTDAKLIGDTLSGDKSAFGELVLRYEKKVFRLVYRIVNNSFDASDIVQETFIKAYKGLAYLKNPDKFQPWLFRIAKNHCTDWLRKKHDDLISVEKELALDCLSLPPTPDEILIENELHEQVMKAIAKLPEHSRKAVQMFYIEGKSYAEIQNELGVKKGTLARWLYEARLQLGKASQHFGFVFASLLRRAFYQSLSTQTLTASTAISITKCLVFSILLHAVVFSQIEFRHTDFASSHGQTYHGTFIEASFMNEIPVENLALNVDHGKIPIASGNSFNGGFRKNEIKRIKIQPTKIPSIDAKIAKTGRLLPISEKIHPELQLHSNVNHQYSVSYKSFGNATYPMDAPKTLNKIDLSPKTNIQPVSIVLADTEIPDENKDKPTINQAIESNEYELVRTIFDKPSKLFGVPSKMALDKNGNIYVSDMIENSIKVLSPSGELLTSWGEKGYDEGKFMRPVGIDVDDDGYVYVADSGNYRIQKFNSDGSFIKAWGKKGYGSGTRLYNDPYSLKNPIALAIDDSGYIYVVDAGRHCIVKFTLDGEQRYKWGSKGSREGYFRTPINIAIDKDNNIYVADSQNCRIQKFRPNGIFLTKWGTNGKGESQFNRISGIAIDSLGNVFVTDVGNNRVQKFTSDGKFLAKWGTKSAGYDHYWRGERQQTPDYGLKLPSDIAITENGDIYILDGWQIKVFHQKPINP